jgi:uncharacterized protein (TIGR04255 family)
MDEELKAIKYSKAPIVEVISEFRFDEPLSSEGIEAVIQSLNDKFPNKESRDIIQVGFNFNAGNVNTDHVSSKRHLLFAADRKMLIQIEDRLLTINRLAPYETWEKFSPNIEYALSKYLAITKAENTTSFGLRYINHIEVDKDARLISEYFNYYPANYDYNLESDDSFVVGIQKKLHKASLLVQLQTVEAKDNLKKAFTLDLNCVFNQNIEICVNDLTEQLNWMQAAHDQILENFIEATTLKLRGLWK